MANVFGYIFNVDVNFTAEINWKSSMTGWTVYKVSWADLRPRLPALIWSKTRWRV